MYKFVPKSNSSYYMAAGEGAFTSDGRNVEMRDEQSDNKDEWYLEFDEASDYVRLPDDDAQNKTMWCWATCAKLVGEHNGGNGALNTTPALLDVLLNEEEELHEYGGTSFYGLTSTGEIIVDGGQREIVVEIHGDDGNHTGTPDDVEDAL